MYLTTLNCLRFLNDREIVQGPKIHQDFTMVAIIPAVTALAHILFLLYIYPSPSAWQPLYTSLPTYPNVTFDLIINPASGPGSATYPDANYNAAISKLRKTIVLLAPNLSQGLTPPRHLPQRQPPRLRAHHPRNSQPNRCRA